MKQEQVNFTLLCVDKYIDELLTHYNKKGNKATPYQQHYINILSVKLEALKNWSIQ